MRTLKDIILEKLKVDDIIIDKEFPIDGTADDMIKFLEENGFKKVPSQGSWSATFLNYKKYNVKCFAAATSGPVIIIEIINRSNPKFKNKLFYLKPNSDSKYNIFDDITTARGGWNANQVSKEDFLKELSEIL